MQKMQNINIWLQYSPNFNHSLLYTYENCYTLIKSITWVIVFSCRSVYYFGRLYLYYIRIELLSQPRTIHKKYPHVAAYEP